jgi:hypothetical protein
MALIEHASPAASRFVRGHLYVRPPAPIDFPAFDSPEDFVGETKRHLDNRTALYLVLKDAFAATSSIGSEQFVYWNSKDARQCLSPDAFVKLGVPDTQFDVWKTWERGAPELGVEIVSKSDHRDEDWEEKLERYRAAGIREVVRFDRNDARRPLRIWDDVGGDLVERDDDDPDLFACQTLGLWWAIVDEAGSGRLLRLARDREGRDLLATPSEARVEAELARREAEEARREAEEARVVAEQKMREEADTRAKLQAERDGMAGEIERLKAALAKAQLEK